VYQTVCALGLDYKCLKRRVKEAASRAQASSPAAFVELVAPGRFGSPECVVELENRAGAKLRIELRGSAVPDLVDLARRFGAQGT